MNIVHIGGEGMNNTATSKEEILKTSRKLIQENGWTGVNIRSVAAACGVSVGCIYNYFDSKTALVGATVASVWVTPMTRPSWKTRSPASAGCIARWSTAAKRIRASLRITR